MLPVYDMSKQPQEEAFVLNVYTTKDDICNICFIIICWQDIRTAQVAAFDAFASEPSPRFTTLQVSATVI